MPNFNNTQIAFENKSNHELNKAYWLFKLISYNTLVKIGNQLLFVSLKLQLPIKGIIKATIFQQFCGGENIEECDKKIKLLGQSNIGTILDYSVEGKEDENDFDNCMNETVATIRKANKNKNIPFCVFKVTGLARFELLEKMTTLNSLSEKEAAEISRVEQRIDTICKTAFEFNIPIFIDAEESWIQNSIDKLANNMMFRYNKERPIVYNTFQLYRTDRLEYLKSSLEEAKQKHFFLGAKLVRGAYMEKERERAFQNKYPSPIHDTKENTDHDYNAAVLLCVENIANMGFCAATHNEESCMALSQIIENKNIPKTHRHIYFAQLLGMSDHISYNLAKDGYNVAKYVPYGPVKEVLPYLIRRAQENTFVKGQTGRELGLIVKEISRRKMNK